MTNPKTRDLIVQASVSIKRTRRLLRDASRALKDAEAHLCGEQQLVRERAHRRLAMQRMLEEVQDPGPGFLAAGRVRPK